MKIAILAIVVAVSTAGFAAGSYAQQPKKLPPHPEASANANGQTSKAINATGSHAGETGGTDSRPNTGATVPSGGSSSAHSKPN